MTSPSERHMEAARTVRGHLCLDCECTFDEGCGCLDAIQIALANAEREGMRRAAEIARDEGIKSPGSVLIPAVSSAISDRILLEIGDKP